MTKSFYIVLVLLLTLNGTAQDFDRLVFEMEPSKGTMAKFSIDRMSNHLGLWTSQIRGVWEVKDSVTVDDVTFGRLLAALDSVDFDSITESSKRGFDGCYYRLILTDQDTVLLNSSVWSPYKSRAHDILLRILITSFSGHFHEEEVVEYLNTMMEEYE